MKKIPALIAISLPLMLSTAQAQEAAVTTWHARSIGEALLYSALFGVAGVAMVLIGFKVFDRFVTKVDLEVEVSKGNVAAAILSGAVIIAISIIIAAVMS